MKLQLKNIRENYSKEEKLEEDKFILWLIKYNLKIFKSLLSQKLIILLNSIAHWKIFNN